MILHVHREPFGLRVEGRSFGHGPGEQHTLVLEPEVVVEMAREMLLHAKEQARTRLGFLGAFRCELQVTRRLRRTREVAFLFVLFERHER